MPDVPEPAVLAVIPARHGSSRFPGKVLAPLAGKPLVAHAYSRAVQARRVAGACVAADDPRIVDALEPLGIPVEMTDAGHPSGTDRIAEVARRRDAGVIVNVQGDEPLIDPRTIDDTVDALLGDPDCVMATARRRITDPESIENPNVVKVVCDLQGRALYFSRWPVPYARDGGAAAHWQHIGLYVYRRDFLLTYAGLPPSPLEEAERLEQLRVLENGYRIAVAETDYVSVSVDTPGDLERVAAMLDAGGGAGKEDDA